MIFNWYVKIYYDKNCCKLLSKNRERINYLTEKNYDNGYVELKVLQKYFNLDLDKITDETVIMEGNNSVFGDHKFPKLSVQVLK